MGKRGPMPKKNHLKVMSGNLPLKKEFDDFQIENLNIPKVPDHLSKEERRIWRQTIDILRPYGVIEDIDGAILAAFCCSYVRWSTSEKEIQRLSANNAVSGLLIKNARGAAINPLVIVSRRAQADAIAYAAQLGMTPSARLRLDTGEADKTVKKINMFEKLKKIKDERMGQKGKTIRKGFDQQK